MLRLYTCIVGQHDLRLVALAAAICILSSDAAVDLLDRARQSSGGRRRAWARTAAAVFGAGIWATHFLADTPVIMVTGRAEEQSVMEAAKLQISGYLVKPVSTKLLAGRIDAIAKQTHGNSRPTGAG